MRLMRCFYEIDEVFYEADEMFDDVDDFLNLIRLYKKEEKNPTKSRVYKKGKNIRNANVKTYPSRTPLKVKVSIFMF